MLEKNSDKLLAKSKTVVQEYLENKEIKKKVSPEVEKTINQLPKETLNNLLALFGNGKVSLYSTIQDFFDNGINNINAIITTLSETYDNLDFTEQLFLAKCLELNCTPEYVKKELMLTGFSREEIDKLTNTFSELKYGNKQAKSSTKHYLGDFPGDFRDL